MQRWRRYVNTGDELLNTHGEQLARAESDHRFYNDRKLLVGYNRTARYRFNYGSATSSTYRWGIGLWVMETVFFPENKDQDQDHDHDLTISVRYTKTRMCDF